MTGVAERSSEELQQNPKSASSAEESDKVSLPRRFRQLKKKKNSSLANSLLEYFRNKNNDLLKIQFYVSCP